MDPRDFALIAQNLLFRGVDFPSIDYMLEHCSIRELAADEMLLQPEIPNHHLYLILEGELSVQLAAQTQEPLKHTTLAAGVCAGEISIVDGKLPSALVAATKPSRVLAVPHDTVWSLVDHSHEVARNLLGIVAGRMRYDNAALITSQKHKVQFEHQAYVDALTGLHNRRWMDDAFPRTLQRCLLDRQPVALMLADIDHFKCVNDTYGHLVGDVALEIIAECMTKNLRPNDLLVRYGGEEFVILLPGSDLEEAELIAERLRSAVADCAVRSDDFIIRVTVSIGIAPVNGESGLQTLLDAADQALYRAKQSGRNRVEVLSAPPLESAARR
ncbi:MAG TPA: GGDEF domain-containing protein [Novimethylophilus sp.]|jgi:diguanylate cyclase (GGDEF)-like protein|uniref:GGDEF domain-containing protein n=1 Tax=Novimethylophilus sp. TaxID=2137426 RepID=UPI002F3E6C2E